MLATEYAQYYKLPAQAEGESDTSFRIRIAASKLDPENDTTE